MEYTDGPVVPVARSSPPPRSSSTKASIMPPSTRMSVPPPLRTRRPTSPTTSPSTRRTASRAYGRCCAWPVSKTPNGQAHQAGGHPDMPVSELRKWSFDNGIRPCSSPISADLAFIKTMPGATVERAVPARRCISSCRPIPGSSPSASPTRVISRRSPPKRCAR